MKILPPVAVAFIDVVTVLRPTVIVSVVGVVRVTAVGVVKVSAVALVPVAAFDKVMVLGELLVPATVVPAGMLAPVIGCPTVTPVRLDTEVTTALPLVTIPVGVTTLVDVAGTDMVIVPAVLLVAMIVAPAGTFVPVIACPIMVPVTLDTDVMTALPLVTKPVGVTTVEAVAGVEIVTTPAEIPVIVASAGIFVPVIG